MRFALSLPNMGPPDRLVSIARHADLAGWDAVFLWDHVQFVRSIQADVHDPWVLLGAIATATERVRLGALVTPLPRRRPQKFAKEVVTLDHLSHGRVIVGVGIGAPAEDEFAMFGESDDARIRGDRLDEALDVVTALWSGEPVRHTGTYFDIDAQLLPTPVQQPRPPIWVATQVGSPRPLRRAARHEGVVPIGANWLTTSADEIRSVAAAMPADHDVVGTRDAETTVAEYVDAGATWLIDSRWPEGAWLDELEAAARRDPHELS